MINMFCDCSRNGVMVTYFWREPAKIGIPSLQSVRWHSTMDVRIAMSARINTADDHAICYKIGKL